MGLFDDFKKAAEGRERSNFASFEKSFNEAMGKSGDKRTLGDFVRPSEPNDPPRRTPDPILDGAPPDLKAALEEILRLTPEPEASLAAARAIGVYRSIVRHVAGGGRVLFQDANGDARTLKVRLRK